MIDGWIPGGLSVGRWASGPSDAAGSFHNDRRTTRGVKPSRAFDDSPPPIKRFLLECSSMQMLFRES